MAPGDDDNGAMPDTVILGGKKPESQPEAEAWGAGGGETTQFALPEAGPTQIKEPDAASDIPTEAGAGRKRKWLLGLAAILLAAAVAAAGVFLARGAMEPEKLQESQASAQPAVQAQEAKAPEAPPVESYRGIPKSRMELEPFIIPFPDRSKKTYLHLVVTLEVDEAKTHALLEANKPVMRGIIYDTVLMELDKKGEKAAFSGELGEITAQKLRAVFSSSGVLKVEFSSSYSV